jgi:phosphoribosylformimino-5-aminoimidazole carboxamide ribotide isomerase
MLIPAIDLKGGRAVQLVQGRDLAFTIDDLDLWIERFASFPIVHVIDLDAALGTGENRALAERVVARLPCRVGGGIRQAEAARAWLAAGARQVIVGSVLFDAGGRPDLAAAAALAAAVGRERLVAAVDSRAGRVVVRGWTAPTAVGAVEAVRALEPHVGAFLYTHVDTEGLMQGIDLEAVRAVRAATSLPVAAAGGIRSDEEIAALDRLGVDAVVGMALYTGRIGLRPPGGRAG